MLQALQGQPQFRSCNRTIDKSTIGHPQRPKARDKYWNYRILRVSSSTWIYLHFALGANSQQPKGNTIWSNNNVYLYICICMQFMQ